MTWDIDPAHSSITFSVRHMMVSTVRGRFGAFRGAIDLDPADPRKTVVRAAIDAATVDTAQAQRDGHLKSPDFLDVEKYPEIAFTSTKVEPAGDKTYRVVGDLTIRGVTKPVTLEAELLGYNESGQFGKRAGIAATTTIDRKDWGLNWNQALETGGLLVSDKVKIELDIQAVEKAAVAAA